MAAGLRPMIVDAIANHPGRALAAMICVHVAVWTVLPTILYPNLPLDLIEALTYGREWQIGYDKLPPLPWWLVEVTHRLVGHDFAYYLLAEIAVAVAFWLVWLTARPIVGSVGALIGVLIIDGIHYYNYTAAKFNHDVIQLPFWALAGFAYRRALKDDRVADWALLGFALGMALWSKYFVVVLAAPLMLFVVLDRQARQSLMRPGPYIAVAVGLAVASPHLVWLVQHDFLPFQYVDSRAAPSRGLIDHVLHPIEFLATQLFFVLPAVIIAVPTVLPRSDVAPPPRDYDWRILTVLAFGPLAAMVALCAVSGRGTVAMWGYPLWLFVGVWLVAAVRAKLDRIRLGRVIAAWAVVFCALVTSFFVAYDVLPARDGRYRAVFFPGDKLGAEMSARFRTLTGRPLAYVIGSMWVGGNVAHYAPERPRVLIDGNPARAPWIDLADLRAHGAIAVWTSGRSDPRVLPPWFRSVAGDAEVQEPFTLPYRRGKGQVVFGWAVLRPRPAVAGLTPAL